MATWQIILLIALLALFAGAVILVIKFPAKVREWLIWAVVEAEKELGTGTGQIKLRQVYDWFLDKFPMCSSLIAFGTFSKWVDVALVEMKKLLDENKSIKNYVNE